MSLAERRYGVGFAGVISVVPLVWALLSLYHPHGEHMLEGHTSTWLLVHWAQLGMMPMLGMVFLLVLDRLEGVAATIGRIAVVFWVALFGAFGAVAGISTAMLVAEGYAGAAEYLWNQSVMVGGAIAPVGAIVHWLAWPVIVIASGVALWRNGAPRIAVVAMFGGLLLMFPEHGRIHSVVGAVALTVAVFSALRGPITHRSEESRQAVAGDKVSATGTAS